MVLDLPNPADHRLARARERLSSASCVLADLDGTLIFGNAPARGAPELVAQFGNRLAVVSNYSTITAVEMSLRLTAMGLPIAANRIFLAGEVAVRELASSNPGARLLCAMAAPMRALATELGLQLVEDEAEIVLVGRDLDLTYARLAAAMRAVDDGAKVYASNPDISHPGAGGRPVPETGSLLSAILAASPATEVVVVGKPQPQLFNAALEALGAAPHSAVMLGDNPDTDIRGARSLGIPAILIGSAHEADTATLEGIAPV